MSLRKLLLLTGIALALFSCGNNKKTEETKTTSSTIKIDGSSTVYPITEAIAEKYRSVKPDINITIGVSGTGGGFKKLDRGELDIADASRKIKDSEAEPLKIFSIKST